jgi:hypothetical protein
MELLSALLGLIAVIVFFVIRGAEERRALLLIAIGAYLLKAIMVPVYFWFLVEIGAGGFAYVDAKGYHLEANHVAFEIVNDLPHESRGWRTKDPGYAVICGFLYAVFGSSTLIARFFNSVFATFTLLYVYRIAVLCFDKRVAKIAVWLAAFLPYPLLVTMNQRKEPVVIFFAMLLFYHAFRFLRKGPDRFTSIPIIVAGIIAIYFFRSGFVLLFIGLFLISYMMTQRSIGEGILVSVFVLGVLAASQILFPDVQQLDVQGNIHGRLVYQAADAQHSGGLLRFVKVTSLMDLWKAPFAAVLLVILPFPPRYLGIPTLYLLVHAVAHLAFLVCLPQFILGMREVFRADEWKKRLPLLIFTGGFLLLIGALSVGVLRYRETVFPLVIVMTAAGFRMRQNIILSGGVYFGLALLAGAVYLHRLYR